jgi:hypothetical protein
MQAVWLDPRRPRIRAVLIGLDMSFCPNRTPAFLFTGVRDIPLEPGDRDFRASRRLTLREGALVRRLRIELSGSVYADGLGTLVSIREVTRRHGRIVSQCFTGQISDDAELLRPSGRG